MTIPRSSNAKKPSVDRLASGFTIASRFDGDTAVLTIGGEIDVFTSAELGAILATLLSNAYTTITLEVAGLHHIDSTGTAVITDASRHAATSGGALTVRSPSAAVARALARSGRCRPFSQSHSVSDARGRSSHEMLFESEEMSRDV